jgi:hypothetical protein
VTTRGVETWTQLVKLPNPDIRILCHFNIAANYECGEDWTSEGSSTYSHDCLEVTVTGVRFNGVSLTLKTSLAEVKVNAGSYYFDNFAQKIYVHTAASENLRGWTIDATNNYVDFYDGSTRAAALTAGTYSPEDLATEIAAEMTEHGGQTYSCSYSFSTGMFTISAVSEFSILWSTGSHHSTSVGTKIGFDVTSDDEGLSSYASDTSVARVTMVFCMKYFSSDTYQRASEYIIYRPLVRKDSFPPMDLAVDDIVEGMYRFNFSSFSLNNDGWFDTASDNYIWVNKRVIIKIGGEALPYSEYQTYFVGLISDFSVSDELVVFTVKDIRVGSYANIPNDHYSIKTYPNMDPDKVGEPIPLLYGVKTNITPVCIDTTAGGGTPKGGKWKICDSRTIKEITEVKKNDTVLTPTTQYTTDLANGEFTLLVKFNKSKGDVLKVAAKGFVDGSSNLIEKGGAIAEDLLTTYLNWDDSELDTASFTNTDSLRTYPLDIYLDTDTSSREVLQTIGRSIVAFFSPTEEGLLSFVAYEPVPPDDTLELFDEDYQADWKVVKDDSWIKNRVQVQYGEDPTTQVFSSVELVSTPSLYKYGVRERLPIITYLRNKEDAENLAGGILDMVSKPITVVSTSFGLKGFTLYPTQQVKITRERAADSSGEFASDVFRIRQVVKDTTGEKTSIVALDDLQTLGAIFCYVCYSCQSCVAQEKSCSICYSCDNCYTTMSGCYKCNACQICNTTQAGCVNCNICQACNTCQVSVGSCTTCQVCFTCDVCDNCQSHVKSCTSCQHCVSTCQTCNTCEVNDLSCATCQHCVSTCQVCNTCEHSVATCVTCQVCNSCQVNYTTCPGGCVSCNTCDSCNTCQSGVKTCISCQVCDSCQVWATCGSCMTCQHCYTAEHPTGCAVCDSCQNCVAAMSGCSSCDTCNTCQECVTCEMCYSKVD